MAEERTEEHEHVIRETDEATHESHHEKIIEKDEGAPPKVTTIEEETTIKKDD
ncbi:MAG TPA: hypothetical protein VK619_03310 [Pyrinomonadaceae bacterium]|nr:hypothetical protein [Pyrinomonadaceae bacterium]